MLDGCAHGVREGLDQDVEEGTRHFTLISGDVGVNACYGVVQLVP